MGVESTLKQFSGSRQVNILLFGKRQTLHKMKISDVATTIPVIGLDEDADVGTEPENIMDMTYGGRMGYRSVYRHYILRSDAIVFVLDTTNLDWVPNLERQIRSLNFLPEKKDAVICVLAQNLNKSSGMTTEELTEKLHLNGFSHDVFSVNIEDRDSQKEAMSWLSKELLACKEKLPEIKQDVSIKKKSKS